MVFEFILGRKQSIPLWEKSRFIAGERTVHIIGGGTKMYVAAG